MKLNPENLVVLADLIENNNDATLTVKKTLYPDEKHTERVQKLRVEFWEKIRDIPVEDLVFLDEAGVNLALVRLYARALGGQRARGSRPHQRGKMSP